jgi:hypothetical protein
MERTEYRYGKKEDLGQLVELLSEILIMPGIIKYTNVR